MRPVQLGVPGPPGKAASCAPEMFPSAIRTETVEFASLASTTRLRPTVPESDAPPVTVEGVSVTDWTASGGGVTTTFSERVGPPPLVALTVAETVQTQALATVRVQVAKVEVDA